MADLLFPGHKWHPLSFVRSHRIYVRVYRYKPWNLNFNEMSFKDVHLTKNFPQKISGGLLKTAIISSGSLLTMTKSIFTCSKFLLISFFWGYKLCLWVEDNNTLAPNLSFQTERFLKCSLYHHHNSSISSWKTFLVLFHKINCIDGRHSVLSIREMWFDGTPKQWDKDRNTKLAQAHTIRLRSMLPIILFLSCSTLSQLIM